MEGLLSWVYGQPAFLQSLMAAAVFSGAVVVSRLIVRLIAGAGNRASKSVQRQMILRYWIYHNYVNSSDIERHLIGFNFLTLHVLRWSVFGGLIAVFALGVDSIVQQDWLWLLAAWCMFNVLFEAHQWCNGEGSEKELSRLDGDIKDEFEESLPDNQKEAFKQERRKLNK